MNYVAQYVALGAIHHDNKRYSPGEIITFDPDLEDDRRCIQGLLDARVIKPAEVSE